MSKRPTVHRDVDALVDEIIEQVGKQIVLALPLGLGKANHVANALVRRAMDDRSLGLTIVTALTLEKPCPSDALTRRFMMPIIERLFGGYPDLLYAEALRKGMLPDNIRVHEFFFVPGRWLAVSTAQQDYVAANYTHAVDAIRHAGVNVVGQLVARRKAEDGSSHYSLSSNPDITLDLLGARRAGEAKFLLIGQVNDELPFLGGDAAVEEGTFDHILDGPEYRFPLFAPPREPVSRTDYALGLRVASLVPDGGTLQIGIGSIGDAIAAGLKLRHQNPTVFAETLTALGSSDVSLPVETTPFEEGLYGCSEIFVPSFLDLMEAGILRREVDGVRLHASFYLGHRDFYKALREMPAAELEKISMTAVSYVNQLYGNEAAKRDARRKARFINSTMMVTLLGAIVSDGLEDGRVVSGVGGQYNFVAQAFALHDARSIIVLRATRRAGGKIVSNIRWSYGHETIPRHLRDIVVTEYGVADLRHKCDREVIESLLAIADSRFQRGLIEDGKAAGKLPDRYRLPERFRENYPAKIDRATALARSEGLLPAFPFGSDFDVVERRLLPALKIISESAATSRWRLVQLILLGLQRHRKDQAVFLERMGLARPANIRELLYQALVKGGLRRSLPLD